MTEFTQQYLGFPWSLFRARLDQLAWEYHTRTEDHDHRCCHHRVGNIAMPVTPEERRDCTRFAQQEYWRLRGIALSEGLHDSLWAAIQRVEREFGFAYVPPNPPDTPVPLGEYHRRAFEELPPRSMRRTTWPISEPPIPLDNRPH